MNRKRAGLVDRIEQSGKDYMWYISQLSADDIAQAPAPGEWTIHQVVAHMRDTEQYVFVERTQRIMAGPHPAVANFDQVEWNREHYAATEPFTKIVAEFRAARRKFVSLLRQASNEDWANWAAHPDYGKISLDWLASHDYQHTLDHLAQIVALRDKALLRELNG
ncbi:MAG: DinB family protein [Chloroflexi bacterium]|nr:DinB family protein [Chloroflexota bacterium]